MSKPKVTGPYSINRPGENTKYGVTVKDGDFVETTRHATLALAREHAATLRRTIREGVRS